MARPAPRAEKPVYIASPWGARFHSLTVDEALGGGAAGGGKSVVLRMEPLIQIAVEYNRCADPEYIPPGFREPMPLRWGESQGLAVYLRRTTPMLRETIRFLKLESPRIDPGVRWNEQDQEFTFPSGYKYRLGHCKDKDDWWNWQGDSITILLLDELTQFLFEQYDQIGSRVRADDAVLRLLLKIRAMSNPFMDSEHMEGVAVDENPNWVRELFVDPCPEGGKILTRLITMSDGEVKKWTRVFLPARLGDNPNPAFARDYERRLRTRKLHIQKALLEGNWYITAGSFFADVWDDKCIVDPFDIPEDWLIFRSMDWGFKKHGCIGWYAMDPDENLLKIREQLFIGQTATEVAGLIREIEEDMGYWRKPSGQKYNLRAGDKRSPLTGPADTQLWEKRGDGSGLSKAEEMFAAGVGWVQADKKFRKRNAEHVYKRLKDRVGGKPSLQFFRGRCESTVKTLPQIQTDKSDPDCPADGGFNHPYDETAYACAFASNGRSGIPRRREEPDWDEDAPSPKKRRGYDFD